MQGLLTGRGKSAAEVPMFRARSRHFNTNRHAPTRHGEEGCEELLFSTLEKIEAVAKSSGISMVKLAMAYPLHKGFKTVIGGFTKPHHVESNLEGVQTKLTPEVLQALDDATVELRDKLGPNADLWQGVAN